MNAEVEKKFAAGLSITSNFIVILTKLVAGIMSGSIGIISEAIHSMSDFLASVIAFFAVSRSSEPADEDHQFGHGRYEDVAGFIEGILIVLASFYIIYEACKKIINESSLGFDTTLGIIVMLFAVIANFLVSRYLFYVAKKTDSVALRADAEHLSTDIYSSLGVLIGLILIKVTGIVLLDPLIAIFVALIILKAGMSIAKETFNNLVDGRLPIEDIKIIENILTECSGIKGYKNLKTRKTGSNRDIDITLICDENMTIKHCHNICDCIEEKIKKEFPRTYITIHCEPFA